MDTLCSSCGARHFKSEKVSKRSTFNDCCCHGTVELNKLPDIPRELKSLFDGSDANSANFFKMIRNYNSSFAFASFNANIVKNSSSIVAPYCFKIQGQIYYQINEAFYPATTDNPTYGQLYIVDPDEAVDHRVSSNIGIDREILRRIDNVIRTNNVFVKSYEMMASEINRQKLEFSTQNEPEMTLLFSLKSGYDIRRYNYQQCNEVAAVFVTLADGEIPESYVTIRNKSTRTLKYMNTLDPTVEPMIYPLFIHLVL